MTSSLPRMRSTTELQGRGVRPGMIRHKLVPQTSAFSVYATHTVAVGGIEPPTTSL